MRGALEMGPDDIDFTIDHIGADPGLDVDPGEDTSSDPEE